MQLALHDGKLNPTVIQRSQLTPLLQFCDEQSQKTIKTIFFAQIGPSVPHVAPTGIL
ncbi:MAG: hypothetical protein V3T16_06365 [Gemmatimonadales bacterium]